MNMMKNQQQAAIHPTQTTNHLPQRITCGLVLLLAMFFGAVRGYAATNYWVAGSGTFSTAGNWSPAVAPVANDTTIFTNETNFTVSLSADTPLLWSSVISNHSGVVTLNPNGFTWQATNSIRIGLADSTTTVYVAGGTLAAAGQLANTGQLRVGDASNIFNCVATLIITNGTVAADAGNIGASATSVGTLIVTNNGKYMDGGTGSASTLTIGSGSNSRLIVIDGGFLFVRGTITVGSGGGTNSDLNVNNSAIFSGPTTLGSITGAGARMNFSADGGSLIVSNGATVNNSGTIFFGNGASYNTGIVVGAGTKMILGGAFQVGTGGTGGTNNFFKVYDGGFISSGGTTAFGNNSFHIGDGIQIGGTGLMSTGLFNVVRSSSVTTNHFGNYVTITNAFVSSAYLNPQGPGETISILSNATWNAINSFSVSTSGGIVTNGVNINNSSGDLLINAGTLSNLRTVDNGGGIAISGTSVITPETGRYGNTLIVTNGGRLLTSAGTLGSGSACNTGIVVGAGSVWSNFSGQAVDPNYTNVLIVGANGGGTNYLGVYNGASLYNNGTFNIGNNQTSVVNTVRFGSPGLPVVIRNVGSLNIGSSSNTYGNVLIITNAAANIDTLNVGNSNTSNNLLQINGGTITVGFVRIRPTNTVVFTAGTLSVGGLTFDTLANNSNAFVVGDGTSAAFYDMVAGGSGTNNFNDGGLVVTNGASLRGSGELEGNVTVLGTLAPGAPGSFVGSMIFSNNLTLGSSATLKYDLGALSDTATINGSLALGGSTINVTDSGGFVANTYVLFTHTNTVTAPSGTITVGTLPAGFTAIVSNDVPNTPRVLLVVSAVSTGPDYGTWLSHYGLTPGGNGLGTADPDNDGMNNMNEFLAGFNPINNAAYVHVINVAKTSVTNITVTYLGASGDNTYANGPASRTNVLEFTTGTANGSYSNNFASTGQTNILSGGTGLGTVTSFVDTNGTSSATKYYRIRVLVP
jgi:hypothetical protein